MPLSTSVSWNGEYFILTAGGDVSSNTFVYAYSPDGINWTKTPFPSNITAQNPYSTKYLGDKYAIIGDVQSSDAKASIVNVVEGSYAVAMPNNLANGSIIYDIESNLEQLHRIVFPRSVSLALGDNQKIAFSVDQGDSWSPSANASSVFSTSANDAVWNGGVWVAVGDGSENTIATSLDGNHWIGRGNYVFETSCKGLDWSAEQNKYLAIGSGKNILATSSDGIYWIGSNNSLFSSGYDVKWNGSIWVAVGDSSGGRGTIAYSRDGSTWYYAERSFDTSGIRLHYDGTLWTAFGQDSAPYNLAKSVDGISWTFSYDPNANALSMDLHAGQFPDASLNIYPGVPFPLRTVDRAILTNIRKHSFNHSDRGNASIQPLTIACGEGAASLAYSVDGIQWTAIHNTIFDRSNKAVWNGKLWVAVGKGTSEGRYWAATSYDGVQWTGRDATILTEAFDVAWNGSLFIAVGEGASSRIAASIDGITWHSVSDNVFSTRIHAIEWTGVKWLAYGSGGNTTAISSDGLSWQATPVPNLCVTDCSNILTGNVAAVAASSDDGVNVPSNAFDQLFNSPITTWNSASSNYSAIDGSYLGAITTTYNTNQTAAGEYLDVSLNAAAVCKNYFITFSKSAAQAIPKSWILLGSTNGVAWQSLDAFNYGTASPPNNSGKYPFVSLSLQISSNVAAYSYYRIVFTSNFGAGHVSVAELSLFGGGNQVLDKRARPVVLKDCILHPTRLLSVSGLVPNIYRITDLHGALIKNGYVHGQFANNVIYGLTQEVAAAAFDGLNHIVLSASGEVSYLSNRASLTHLNFDNSFNGLVQSGLTSIYSACYNRKYLILGGGNGSIAYGVLDASVPSVFHIANADSIFTHIYGLASNSGHGFVVSPNTIQLKEDDRLSVVTPKYYDSALSADTSISFNVYKSNE